MRGGTKAVSPGKAAFNTFEGELAESLPLFFPADSEAKNCLVVTKALVSIFEHRAPERLLLEECKRDPHLLSERIKPLIPPGFNPSHNPDITALYGEMTLQLSALVIDLSKEATGEGQWEIEFRETIARRFDVLNLFGVDVSQEARRHQLSVAYIALTMENLHSGENLLVEENLPIETILSKNKRVVIQGVAGQDQSRRNSTPFPQSLFHQYSRPKSSSRARIFRRTDPFRNPNTKSRTLTKVLLFKVIGYHLHRSKRSFFFI